MAADTAAALLRPAAEWLAASGVADAAREARLLLALATGCDAGMLAVDPGRVVPADAAAAFDSLLARRAAREPFAQIAGRREFWSREFAVTADVLTPRPDSETLVQAACDRFPDRRAALRVLDLGTGSGCLLLSVLGEFPNAAGIGVDLSGAALVLARDNALRLGLAARAGFVQGDWDMPLAGRFDLVLCNPPYIAAGEMPALAPEVTRFEPPLALSGGPDGLDAYRRLGPALVRLLAPGGIALVEIGIDQAIEVKGIFSDSGAPASAVLPDLAGIPRCVVVPGVNAAAC